MPIVGAPIVNAGGVGLRYSKIISTPPASPTAIVSDEADSDGGQAMVAHWDLEGPNAWLARKDWLNAMVGYSLNPLAAAAGAASPTLSAGGASGSATFSATINRIIPAQAGEDQCQHLYAHSYSMVEPKGYWLNGDDSIGLNDGQLGSSPAAASPGGGNPTITTGTNAGSPIGLVTVPWPSLMEQEGIANAQHDALAAGAAAGAAAGGIGGVLAGTVSPLKPLLRTSGTPRYAITYRPRPYVVRTDAEIAYLAGLPENVGIAPELQRYVERTSHQALTSQPLPSGTVVWGTDAPAGFAGQAIPDNANYVLVPTRELRYVWYEVPDLNEQAYDDNEGKINAARFDGAKGYRSYAAQTLLCQPVQRKQYQHANGAWYWRITFTFLFRSTGWSQLLGSDGTNYHAVGFKAANQPNGVRPIYGLGDFNTLFQLGLPNQPQ